MDEVEEPEDCLAASVLAMVYRAPENTTMEVNLRLFDLTRLDARFDDEFLVENFRFRRAEIGIFMEHIRLPEEIKVNGSRYTKLEGLLCSWWRGATAAQGTKAEPLFGLDRRRLSELRIHVHQLLIADHCKILHTLAPWPDEWLEFMVDCCSNVAGEYASELNTFFCTDGHFNETCRPTEYSASRRVVPYGDLQRSVFSGHTRAHGLTYLNYHGVWPKYVVFRPDSRTAW